jgi:hypothetical protein
MRIILTALITLFTFQVMALSENVDVKNRLSMLGVLDFIQRSEGLELSWVPEISLSQDLGKGFQLQGEYSLQARLDQAWHEQGQSADINAESYRYWFRLSNPQAELRAGLQRLNFGTAQILRPLQWFDRINPLDMNEETKGVQALLYRYYFVNNANVWLWGILGENTPKGNEILASQDNALEFGGRFQHPLPYSETALSFHTRALEVHPGITVREYRAGMDLRCDTVIGLWLESSGSHFRGSDLLPFRHLISSTLGLDYTFGLGNGLYAVLETNLSYSSPEDLDNLRNQSTLSALMLDYPLGLLDNIALLSIYDYKCQKSLHSLVFRRIYDHLSFEASLTHDLNRDFGGIGNRSINLSINYNL